MTIYTQSTLDALAAAEAGAQRAVGCLREALPEAPPLLGMVLLRQIKSAQALLDDIAETRMSVRVENGEGRS